jgi:hypothetical protein
VEVRAPAAFVFAHNVLSPFVRPPSVAYASILPNRLLERNAEHIHKIDVREAAMSGAAAG